MNKKTLIFVIFIIIVIFSVGIFLYFKILPATKNAISTTGIRPAFSLIKENPDARNGDIWISQNQNGLEIQGTVDGKKPNWPQGANEDITAYDHIELWISDSKELKMPAIGWGNQFGETTLASENDCNGDVLSRPIEDPAHCKAWFEDQIKFREQFEKLFLRQWQMAPGIVKETHATNAYNSLSDSIQKDLAILKPTITPTVAISDGNGKSAYNFTIEVPWKALPPMQSLSLENIKILVGVSNPGPDITEYSSTSGEGSYMNASSLSLFNLPQPREYHITSCKYPLDNNYDISQPDLSDESSVYFFPGNDLNIKQAFSVVNIGQGYQYEPYDTSTSPGIYKLDYFEKEIKPGETICGPSLAYVKDSRIIRTEDAITSAPLDVKHISDDEVLVKSGPYTFYSPYGSGQCGLCTRGALDIVYIDLTSGTSVDSYSFSNVFDTNDSDFQISPDWKKITEYNYDLPADYPESAAYDPSAFIWHSTDYCFNGKTHIYDKCGTNNKAVPPSPRFFDPQADDRNFQ